MAPHGKKIKKTATHISRSKRCGLIFPVGRVFRIMKSGNFARRVGIGAAIYLTAIVEYLSAEILELAASAATDNRRLRVAPRHILLAIRTDEELDLLLQHAVISEGGILPKIHKELLPVMTQKNQTDSNISSQEY